MQTIEKIFMKLVLVFTPVYNRKKFNWKSIRVCCLKPKKILNGLLLIGFYY